MALGEGAGLAECEERGEMGWGEGWVVGLLRDGNRGQAFLIVVIAKGAITTIRKVRPLETGDDKEKMTRYRLIAVDFLLMTLVFFLVNQAKRGTFGLPEGYGLLLGLFYLACPSSGVWPC